MNSTRSSKNKDTKAPWSEPEPTVGQDPWNRSTEARRHPELYSTAHGTSGSQMEEDLPPMVSALNSKTTADESAIKPVANPKDTNTCERDTGISFGHTIHKHASRRRSSVLRDLTLI